MGWIWDGMGWRIQGQDSFGRRALSLEFLKWDGMGSLVFRRHGMGWDGISAGVLGLQSIIIGENTTGANRNSWPNDFK